MVDTEPRSWLARTRKPPLERPMVKKLKMQGILSKEPNSSTTKVIRRLKLSSSERTSREDSFSRRITFVVEDRKSTRLNSSHLVISYAVFCLKKKDTPVTPPNACV